MSKDESRRSLINRWGYHKLSVVEDVVENYRSTQIPLNVIWNDDGHMDARKDFTLSPVNYPRPKLLAFLDKIHKRGMKYIVAARHVHQESPARAPARDAGTSQGAYEVGAAAG
ncbi:hypothetical protein ZWY2020_042198 [Hordeum vulgare]|nr:hypothetical protein ZWY2020_042198 [Hordeum vulgare]